MDKRLENIIYNSFFNDPIFVAKIDLTREMYSYSYAKGVFRLHGCQF